MSEKLTKWKVEGWQQEENHACSGVSLSVSAGIQFFGSVLINKFICAGEKHKVDFDDLCGQHKVWENHKWWKQTS